jgi:hypothetical protein
VVEQTWELQRGLYQIFVGKSVVDVPLKGTLDIVDA